ncbi:MAG: Mycothiol acetyltransferase [Actinomycetota bacterium]
MVLSMDFRLASEEDLDSIVKVFLACWKESYSEILSADVRDSMNTDEAKALWSKSFSDTSLKTYLLFDSAIPVAVFRYGASREDENASHLFSLYVDPQFSGRGIGKLIMEKVLAMAKSDSFNKVTLWVFEKNRPARSLYEKFGFIPTGRNRITPAWGEVEVELAASLI